MVDFDKLLKESKHRRSGQIILMLTQEPGDLETVDRDLKVTTASGDFSGIAWLHCYIDAVGLAAAIDYEKLGIPNDVTDFSIDGHMQLRACHPENDEDEFIIESLIFTGVSVKAERTHCTTKKGKKTVIDVVLALRGDAVQLYGGPTGAESFVVHGSGNADLDRLKEKGWWACAGTQDRWDSLFVPPESMKRAMEVLKL